MDPREKVFLQRRRRAIHATNTGLSQLDGELGVLASGLHTLGALTDAARGPVYVDGNGILLTNGPDRRIEFTGTGGTISGFDGLLPRTAPAMASLDAPTATVQDVAAKVNEIIAALGGLGLLDTA